MTTRQIQITEHDYTRLKSLLEEARTSRKDAAYLEKLDSELERAEIVLPQEVSADVVTMNSKVHLKDLDTGEEYEYQLVFPKDADADQNRLSVLAPVGTALLGFKVGDKIEWEVPAGIRHLSIEKIIYQPESAGNYTL